MCVFYSKDHLKPMYTSLNIIKTAKNKVNLFFYVTFALRNGSKRFFAMPKIKKENDSN